MSTNRNLPLRGIADSTKRESAPPALAPGESISTTCLLFNAQWSVSYTGPPGHEKEFFKVLASIHEAKK